MTGRAANRIPLVLVIAALAVVVGAAGLVRGWIEPSAASSASRTADVPASAITVGDIAVYAAYIREPASTDVASAYLTITNIGDRADTLTGISTGASTMASLHDVPGPGSSSTAEPSNAEEAAGAETMTPSGPVTLAPGQTIALKPGAGHIMLEELVGKLLPGQKVSILLTFERAGDVLVDAPVIAIGATPPAS